MLCRVSDSIVTTESAGSRLGNCACERRSALHRPAGRHQLLRHPRRADSSWCCWKRRPMGGDIGTRHNVVCAVSSVFRDCEQQLHLPDARRRLARHRCRSDHDFRQVRAVHGETRRRRSPDVDTRSRSSPHRDGYANLLSASQCLAMSILAPHPCDDYLAQHRDLFPTMRNRIWRQATLVGLDRS